MKRSACTLLLSVLPLLLFARPLELTDDDLRKSRPDTRSPLRLTFAGDIMAHSVNYEMEDPSSIYSGVAHVLLSDDLSFANLEFPIDIGAPQTNYPAFNVHPKYVEAAIRGGFDVFSLANNHVLDRDLPGFFATLESMKTLSRDIPYRIWTSGIKYPNEAWEVTEIKTRGWKIGFVAATQYSNTPGTSEHLRLVDYRINRQAEEFIRWVSARSGNYDLFIVSYHGDVEYSRQADPRKRDFFLKLLEAGTDILWGHHPHVLQPVELFHTDEGEKIILNSCGNFVSGQNRIIDPERPDEDWSYTGDSALFLLEAGISEGRVSLGIRRPLLIGHIMTADRDVIVLPLETIASSPLYREWEAFYTRRFEMMSSWAADGFLIEHPRREDPSFQ